MQDGKFELTRGSHSVGECNFHLVFTVAYRRKAFKSAHVLESTRGYIRAKAEEMRIRIAAVEFGPDHVHVFTTHCSEYSVKALGHDLKGYASKMMREHHFPWVRAWLWGKKFWTRGFFYRSVGSVTAEAVKFYINNAQKKHWTYID